MKRHPPIHYSSIYPSSSSQTGAQCPCDSMISPPIQHTHALRTQMHTHTVQAWHVHTLLPIHRPPRLLSHIYVHIYILHATRSRGTGLLHPIAADQSMRSFSQCARIMLVMEGGDAENFKNTSCTIIIIIITFYYVYLYHSM